MRKVPSGIHRDLQVEETHQVSSDMKTVLKTIAVLNLFFVSRTVHDTSRADRGLNCDECESSFAKMAHLIRHKTSIHNSKPEGSEDVKPPKEGGGSNIKISGKPQLCTECGKTFENERLLSYHQNWHKGLQPYVCEEQDCVYRSHSKIGLQKHNIQVHITHRLTAVTAQ